MVTQTATNLDLIAFPNITRVSKFYNVTKKKKQEAVNQTKFLMSVRTSKYQEKNSIRSQECCKREIRLKGAQSQLLKTKHLAYILLSFFVRPSVRINQIKTNEEISWVRLTLLWVSSQSPISYTKSTLCSAHKDSPVAKTINTLTAFPFSFFLGPSLCITD